MFLTPETKKDKLNTTISGIVQTLGPGMITAALIFGPGSLTVTSKLGAGFGFKLLWIILFTTLFMIVFTLMSARIGLTIKPTLLQHIRERYGVMASIIVGMGIFLVTISFQAGNSIGAGIAFAELFNTRTEPWVVFFSLLAIAILFFRSFYKILEKIMIGMVSLMLLSFLVTAIISKPPVVEILQGLSPSIPKGSEILTIALVASSFSIVGAFYQAYLVREKGWGQKDIKACSRETIIGITMLGSLTLVVMICSGSVLHTQGITVNSATDMGKAIEPLFGKFTAALFMSGLFAASFSSLIGNATIGGTLLADTFNMGNQLKSKKVRLLIMLVIVFGASIAIIYGKLPLQFIVFAQGITIIVVPVMAAMIFLIANNTNVMGPLRNRPFTNLIALLGLAILVVLAVTNIKLVFLN
ncbi:Nramp family divalent metal transporter [Fulvivirgaceae bacterium BMA12]|uniref:Nramp family divalent metal transporter n=1 Tax=Agaribacillus aureus TaxID=3051825 RepID=A0ABT8L1Z6_9BACT|nr:Nramp family divalent metal transporter [Fulvivirgaceae bacterium BMA12]